MFLDDEDIVSLTGKTRKDAQARALQFMGISFRLRPDGSAVVLRSSVEQLFGSSGTTKRKTAPNFSLVR